MSTFPLISPFPEPGSQPHDQGTRDTALLPREVGRGWSARPRAGAAPLTRGPGEAAALGTEPSTLRRALSFLRLSHRAAELGATASKTADTRVHLSSIPLVEEARQQTYQYEKGQSSPPGFPSRSSLGPQRDKRLLLTKGAIDKTKI